MPISNEIKAEIKETASQLKRDTGTTRAVGVVLYSDGAYGDFHYGYSGRDLTERRIFVVIEHHNLLAAKLSQLKLANKKPQAVNLAYKDAEVDVFNSAGKECNYWKKDRIFPRAMYIYIIGPHDMCQSCKLLMNKFAQSYGLRRAAIETGYHKAIY